MWVITSGYPPKIPIRRALPPQATMVARTAPTNGRPLRKQIMTTESNIAVGSNPLSTPDRKSTTSGVGLWPKTSHSAVKTLISGKAAIQPAKFGYRCAMAVILAIIMAESSPSIMLSRCGWESRFSDSARRVVFNPARPGSV